MLADVRGIASVEDVWAADDVNRASWTTAFREVFPEHVLDAVDVPPEQPWVESRFALLCNHPGFLLATVKDEVVGYAYVDWTRTAPFVGDSEAELKELYVHPDYWKEGIGTMLLDSICDAVPGGRTALVLSTPEENHLGRSFYESRGFVLRETLPATDPEGRYPSVVYARDLTTDTHWRAT
ncbi:GNAT family N-acetyltransferase [Haloarchaeobius sp. TZWWS8]|uniref:GNAT family N-acetyltransferase n=1 Tax=Haloarchaeobius sp. TZWWS8 TaxID=3446121 RepID=UPI003EBE7922